MLVRRVAEHHIARGSMVEIRDPVTGTRLIRQVMALSNDVLRWSSGRLFVSMPGSTNNQAADLPDSIQRVPDGLVLVASNRFRQAGDVQLATR
jgi:hypothetical protein